MTTLVSSVDWSFADHPQPTSPNMHGLARSVLVGAAQGAVHTELAATAFQLRCAGRAGIRAASLHRLAEHQGGAMSHSSLPLEPAKPKTPGGAASLLAALGRSTAAMLVLSGIGFLLLWQVISMNVSPVILPAPADVFVAFIALTASGELVSATLATIWPFAIGLVLGFVVGPACTSARCSGDRYPVTLAPIAQGIEQRFPKPLVAGSTPAGDA